MHIAEQMQGLRSTRKRSLLFANEHFERKRNAADAREMCSPTRKAHSLKKLVGLFKYNIRRFLLLNRFFAFGKFAICLGLNILNGY